MIDEAGERHRYGRTPLWRVAHGDVGRYILEAKKARARKAVARWIRKRHGGKNT